MDLKHAINGLITCFKNVEIHYKTNNNAASNRWTKVACMLDGDYKPTHSDKADWLLQVTDTLSIAVSAVSIFELKAGSSDLPYWEGLYQASYDLSEVLLRELKRDKPITNVLAN